MKHTPAPWQADAYDDGAFEIRNGAWPHGFIIASRNGYPDWKRAAESKANAHLIAAAPELLEALESLLELVPEMHGTTRKAEDHNAKVERAKNAIAHAKAKGQGGE